MPLFFYSFKKEFFSLSILTFFSQNLYRNPIGSESKLGQNSGRILIPNNAYSTSTQYKQTLDNAAARNLINSVPQTEATTFAFSSVFILSSMEYIQYSTVVIYLKMHQRMKSSKPPFDKSDTLPRTLET